MDEKTSPTNNEKQSDEEHDQGWVHLYSALSFVFGLLHCITLVYLGWLVIVLLKDGSRVSIVGLLLAPIPITSFFCLISFLFSHLRFLGIFASFLCVAYCSAIFDELPEKSITIAFIIFYCLTVILLFKQKSRKSNRVTP